MICRWRRIAGDIAVISCNDPSGADAAETNFQESSMKKLAVLIVVAVAVLAVAQESKPLYQQTAKWTIGGDGFWDYLALSPDGSRLFVAHATKIEVVDTSDGKVVGSVPVDGAHGTAIVADKGLGFSTDGRSGQVTVFDTKTLQVKTQIKVGEGPDAIIYDPFAKRVIVMHGRSKDIAVIDPATLKVDATVPLGGKLEFAAADKNHVYVNVEDKGEIAAVNSKTWKEDNRWKLDGCEEPSGLAIDEKTDRLFAVCGNKVMIVVDTKTGKQLASLPTGPGTDAAAFDPGLKRAFAPNGGAATLTVVQQKSDGGYEVAGNVDTQRGARTMALDPKTHKIYLATAELGPPAEGQRRPTIKPGSFMILVYSPAK
jgi:YVTN family beta-propeller protein